MNNYLPLNIGKKSEAILFARRISFRSYNKVSVQVFWKYCTKNLDPF